MPRNIKRYTSNSTDNKTKQLLFNEQAQSSSYMEKNKQREATKLTRPRRTLQSSRRAKGTQTPQTSQILPFPLSPLSALPRSSGRASCTELGRSGMPGVGDALTRRRGLALPLGVLHHLLGYPLGSTLLPLLLNELLQLAFTACHPDLISRRYNCTT